MKRNIFGKHQQAVLYEIVRGRSVTGTIAGSSGKHRYGAARQLERLGLLKLTITEITDIGLVWEAAPPEAI